MEFPKDFEIQDPSGPVTAKPVPRRRSPVSGSNWLGSWDVSSGMNGESGDSWDQSNWSQSSAAPALPHSSQPTPACCRDGEMCTPSFTHPTHMSYRTLLAPSDPAITSNTTNVAPSMLAQITGRGSGSQIMPPASASQDQLAQIAGRGSSSQMMPPSQIAHITSCGSSSQMIPPASPRQNQQAQTAGHCTNSCMMPPFPRLDQNAGWGSSSLMTPPASPRQDQLPQIAVRDSSSQMMPPASSRQNQCISGPASSLSSSVHWPNSQYGLPFPLPPNLNSAPETSMTNTVASKSVVVSPATPANLGRNTKMQDLRFNEIIDLVDDTTSQNVQQNEFRTSQQTALEAALPSFSNPGVSPNIMSLQQQESEINVLPSAETPLQQAERENQGMDLNKTPEQKPRRKKHRPKVIREGKPAKTPKPVTPKPVTPRRAQKTESPSQGKRKYVWKKKKDPNSVDNPSETVGESINSQIGTVSKPVRRSLNFDNEECQARDDRAGSEMMFTPDAETQVAIASSNTISDVQSVQGWDMGVSENHMGSGMSFDLNSSANHQFDNGYLSNTEGVKRATHIQDKYLSMLKCMTSPPQTARKEGENLQKLARKNNDLNVACNHVIASEDGQNQIASDKIYDALLKGTKRGHSLVDDAHVIGDISHRQANNGMERVSVIQKQSTENGQNEGTSNSYSTFTCTPSDPKTIQAAQNTSEAVTFADAQRFMAYKRMRSSDHILGFNQAEITSNNRPSQASRAPSHKAVVDCQRASTPVKPSGHVNAGCYQPSTPERPSEFTNNHDSMSIGPQARIEALIASNQLKLKAKGLKKKEQLQVNPMFSNAKRLENQTTFSATESSRGQESLSTYSSRQIVDQHISHLHVSFALDCQGDTSNYKGSVSRGSKLGTLIPYRDPVDEIIQKLSRLNINGGKMNAKDQEQNALVPYDGGVGTMVIFEGKKRRPRPKVDLDPESDRVWRVLMGKEADEEMGADKEKWWEEERRVFRGRAESFIARMHLVQGDRRFSKWKGSVVDSVIGVFLTQNVSDHLSSSAFMSLAARFPVRSSANNNATNVEKIKRSIASDDSMSGQGKMSEQQSCDQSSVVIHEVEHVDGKEMENNHESPVSNTISSTLDYLESNNLNSHEGELRIGNESPDCGSATAVTVRSSTSGVDCEDRSSMEDAVSSQNSVTSHNFSKYHFEAADQGKLNSQLNFDADDLLSVGMGNGFNSFTELLKRANSRGLQEMNGPSNGRNLSTDCCAGISQFRFMGVDQMTQLPNHAGPSIFKSNSHFQAIQSDHMSLTCAPSLSCYYQNSLSSTFVGLENTATAEDCNQSNASSAAASVDKTNGIKIMGRECSPSAESSTKAMNHHSFLASRVPVDMYAPRSERSVLPITSLQSEIDVGMDSCCQSLKDKTHASNKTISSRLSISPENITMLQQRERGAISQVDSSQHEVKAQDQMGNVLTQDFSSKHNHQEKTLEGVGAVKPDFKKEASISQKSLAEASKDALKAKKVKAESDRKKSFDWDSLRKQACCNGAKKERSSDAMDSLDYEALRNADVNVIAHAIRERGMNNLLAERIKDFLNRLVNDHGSIDLEWLRDVLPEKTKDYLLSIRGLGLKSVECVRLLTLHHLAFPVDTNVGRICVRLGWVPLQPLPESLQLHLLEMYPVLETIQKYLWPRLCKLDQRTLYELHYQLITFGKVFCTKSKPNCNACPMRGECKHFASAFASARLALPGPEEKSLVGSTIPSFPEGSLTPVFKSVPLPQLEGSTHTKDRISPRNCEPTIEEPASPEPECVEALECEIEDAFFDDPDEIPTIKLNMEEFTQNLQCYMQQNNIELQDGDMSKALVAITPEAASIPMAKLKNVSRLRTEHQVYELPDSHPLLEGLDRRERDDPSPYLLAIWTPGETAQSIEPPKVCCNSQDTGNLCMASDCFGCNSIREAKAQLIRGTILIPCRTAMRGSFPLNGTYFQVNEVFADHDSSRFPIDVPRNWIWNLPRRTVYFGTSVPTIFKGLTTEGIQHCFWRGFVCVRGFDRTTRSPKPLYARLHFPASKTTKDKRAAAEAMEK